jgi:hypothetical protein
MDGDLRLEDSEASALDVLDSVPLIRRELTILIPGDTCGIRGPSSERIALCDVHKACAALTVLDNSHTDPSIPHSLLLELALRDPVMTAGQVYFLIDDEHFAASIMRILVANVADKYFLFVVPALEVTACKIQEILGRRIGKHSNVFFGDIAYGFVVGTWKIER